MDLTWQIYAKSDVIGYENVPNVYVLQINEGIKFGKFSDLMSDLEMMQNLKCFFFILVHSVSLI